MMPKGKKKAEKVEKVAESTVSREISSEEQQIVDEQDRQKRVANCTVAVQEALRNSNCDLDITITGGDCNITISGDCNMTVGGNCTVSTGGVINLN